MALPKRKLELDPPDVIAVRDRLRPEDGTIVLAKNATGTVVLCLNVGVTHTWPDGKAQPYAPWEGAVPEHIRNGMCNGIAESKEFYWVPEYGSEPAKAQGHGWEMVSGKCLDVYCPYARGDKTSGGVKLTDCVLYWRPREIGEERARQKAAYDAYARPAVPAHIEGRDADGGTHTVAVESGIEASPGDAITISQEIE
jgi:hypothetical protein